MFPKPRVTMQVDIPGRESVVVCHDIDCREALRPIDHPDRFADAFTSTLLCTAPSERAMIESVRKELAEGIVQQLTHDLLEALGAGDTVMGYAKERRRDRY